MQNSQLIFILQTFSKKELRELKKWLDSPAHNQREDVTQLFDYLTTGSRLEQEKHLKKEKIFSKLFPKTPFDDARLRQTMHFLLRAVEEFLIWQALQEDTVRAQIVLASEYRKRRLVKPFQKTVRQIEDTQEQFPYRNEQYLRNEYLLQQEKYLFQDVREKTREMNLQEVSDALDLTYLADKLRQSCLMLAHQAVYKVGYNMGLLNEVLAHVEHKKLTHLPGIAIYYYSYKMLSERDNPAYFEELKKQIQQFSHLFPHAEIRTIYLAAINYCVGRLNAGQEAYIREAFDLYHLGFEQGILIENNKISTATFHNAAAIGLKLKEYKWVDTFIHKHRDYIEADQRESFFLFNLAKLRYEQRDYDSAMRLLAQTDFDNLLVHLNAKTMLFKMYYELDEVDALESLLESLRTYISRKEVIGYHRANYQNIIRYTKKLVRINPYNKVQKEKLREEIVQANPLTERDWLLKQLDAI